MVGIYKITNSINGKSYIGQSTNVEKRFLAHKNNSHNPNSKQYNSIFYRAIRKYGLENFTFEVLEECDRSELNDKEKKYIKLYNTHGEKGYNLDDGGGSSHFIRLSYDKVTEIITLLRNSLLNTEEIGRIYNVSGRTVRSINSGEYYYRGNITYPIRPPLFTIESIDDSGQYIKKNKENFCCICGASISIQNKMCLNCSHIVQRKANRPDPLSLANMIVEFGFKGTGLKFGVNGNTIKKWCKGYNIPHKIKELEEWLANKNKEIV